MALPAILISVLGPLIGNVLDKVIPNKDERAKATEEITEAIANVDLEVIKGQLKINELEATNGSLFVSGARPFLLWGSGLGVLYMTIAYPNLVWLCRIRGWPEPPPLDGDMLMSLTTGMLGLAGIRGWEKVKGVARIK